MRSKRLLGLFLLPLVYCAETGSTATKLINIAAPLTIMLVGTDSDATYSKEELDYYRADTAFYTPASGKMTFVCHLATGDSLESGQGDEGPFWHRNPPPLSFDTVIVRPATGPAVRLTEASIQQFVTGTSEDYLGSGESVRIIKVYRVAFPQLP